MRRQVRPRLHPTTDTVCGPSCTAGWVHDTLRVQWCMSRSSSRPRHRTTRYRLPERPSCRVLRRCRAPKSGRPSGSSRVSRPSTCRRRSTLDSRSRSPRCPSRRASRCHERRGRCPDRSRTRLDASCARRTARLGSRTSTQRCTAGWARSFGRSRTSCIRC